MNTTTASTAYTRPEDRCRGGDVFGWSDTLPACYRSEAFAEDLDGPAEEPPRAQAPAIALHPRR